jgi:hypothetical protein
VDPVDPDPEHCFSVSSFKFRNLFVKYVLLCVFRTEGIPRAEKIFRCGYCPKTFTKSFNLKSHLLLQTGEKHMVVQNVQKRLQEKQAFKVIYLSTLK